MHRPPARSTITAAEPTTAQRIHTRRWLVAALLAWPILTCMLPLCALEIIVLPVGPGFLAAADSNPDPATDPAAERDDDIDAVLHQGDVDTAELMPAEPRPSLHWVNYWYPLDAGGQPGYIRHLNEDFRNGRIHVELPTLQPGIAQVVLCFNVTLELGSPVTALYEGRLELTFTAAELQRACRRETAHTCQREIAATAVALQALMPDPADVPAVDLLPALSIIDHLPVAPADVAACRDLYQVFLLNIQAIPLVRQRLQLVDADGQPRAGVRAHVRIISEHAFNDEWVCDPVSDCEGLLTWNMWFDDTWAIDSLEPIAAAENSDPAPAKPASHCLYANPGDLAGGFTGAICPRIRTFDLQSLPTTPVRLHLRNHLGQPVDSIYDGLHLCQLAPAIGMFNDAEELVGTFAPADPGACSYRLPPLPVGNYHFAPASAWKGLPLDLHGDLDFTVDATGEPKRFEPLDLYLQARQTHTVQFHFIDPDGDAPASRYTLLVTGGTDTTALAIDDIGHTNPVLMVEGYNQVSLERGNGVTSWLCFEVHRNTRIQVIVPRKRRLYLQPLYPPNAARVCRVLRPPFDSPRLNLRVIQRANGRWLDLQTTSDGRTFIEVNSGERLNLEVTCSYGTWRADAHFFASLTTDQTVMLPLRPAVR